MIEKAREHAAALALTNVDWHVGNVAALPFPDRSVLTRGVALRVPPFRRSARACCARWRAVATRPGRVVVADVAASDDPARAEAFNRMERLRDPSHTRALTLAEWRRLFADAGLPAPRETYYDVRGELEGLLATSFPAPGDLPVIRKMFADSLADDGLGMKTRRKDDRILLSYPIAILAADLA